MQALLRKIRQILKDRRTRKFFTRIVSSVAAIVVFVTTYALILPAITLEKTAICGIEAHQHDGSCYEERLVCGQEESDGHHHDDSCYTTTTELTCGIQEHQHSAEKGCYDADGNLVCQLQVHAHDDSCYEEVRTLTCGLEEFEGHHHTDACYEKVLACGKEVHIHSDKCYEEDGSKEASADSNSDGMTSNPSGAGNTDNTGKAAPGVSDSDEAAEEKQSDSYVPELEPVDMDAMLNSHTDFYYFHAEEEEKVPADSAEIADWKKVEEETVLTSTDLVKMYLAYTIPAGSLNDTNPSARYRLPSNLHLSDQQIKAMNRYENGIVAGYRDSATASDASDTSDTDEKDKEIENYQKYLGAEAVEGDRRPDEQLNDGAQEYISAVVRAENVYDDKGMFLGQDLIFTFVPYSIDKNRNNFDAEKKLVAAGEKITGWFACDFRLDQIDWEQEKSARVTFVEEDQKKEIEEIVRVLRTAGEIGDRLSNETMTDVPEETGEDQDDQVFKAGTLTFEGDDYSITLDYDEEAKIPENASLSVREITAETDKEAYESCLEQAGQQVAADDKTSVDQEASRFFDIEILVTETDSDGTEKTVKIEPSAPVSVNIKINEKPASLENESDQNEPTILHFAEEGVEQIDSTITDSQDGHAEEQKTEIQFEAESFSVYGVVYTVDFEYSVNGKMYQFSLPGGEKIALSDLIEVLGILGDTYSGEKAAFDSVEDFLKEVANVEFSDESLVKVTKNEEDNDWTLESLQPFSTEEGLTITMKNGDVITVKVTDAQEIEDAEKNTIDPNKSYLICYEVDGVYYLLKNDGTVDSAYHLNFEGDTDSEHDFEHLNSTYAWTFSHIFKEQDVEEHLDKNYYLIRPIDNKSRTITLNNVGEALVQQGNNNVAVIQTDGGFILEGYHNIGTADEPRYIHLGFDGGTFAGVEGDGVTVHIYEMNSLPTYDYTVRSADEIRGTVTVSDGTEKDVTDNGNVVAHYYDVTSTSEKKNGGTITANPVDHRDTGGRNKWQFDHWELDGLPLDREQYPATIQAETLPIPHNGSNLVAYFRQNPNYVVPPSEKEPSSIEDMTGWLEGLQSRNIPLDNSATTKTAEVYDYQNRIYRVDFTSKANFETFAGNLDMAFCLDVSNSMYFPSALVEADTNHDNPMPIYQINNSGRGWSNQGWLDTNRNWNNPYYLVADASGTATVFRIYYKDGYWKAQDASRTTEGDKSFKIGQEDFTTNYGQDARHPFTKGDTDNTTYTIYDAGDDGKNRFVYLNQSLSGSSTDLNTISGLLAVAGDASPGVKIAYNTFNGSLGNQRMDFTPASSGLTVNLNYASGGGTRPDEAFKDAQNFSWSADYTVENGELTATDRYVILVTDGAPQGGTAPSSGTVEDAVVAAARNLKNNSHVKLITVGLSMDNVTSGKRLLYDLADFDNNGNKMFYMAESGSDLQNIFRQITKVLMEDAVVLGDITDTVGEGFYLVDKATGMPLGPGATIDIEGNLTTDADKVAGVVQDDGRTIKWFDQPIDSVAGWHGTVYVKAQEELLGGNAMNTNDGEATLAATKYRVGGKDVEFDTSLVRDTLNLTADFPSPKVNVNELTFFNNETDWTVYLGTEVDPKEQLKALYDSLVVEEVVNENGSLHYTINPNSIEERWGDATGTAATFSLPGLIETLIRKDSALEARYFIGSELNWDVFLGDLLSDGITLPYHEFGLTDGSNIKITLEKTTTPNPLNGATTTNLIPSHETTVVGDEVEKYALTIQYNPDYTVTPVGQGGQSTDDFHTGTYGTMYQGHATGRESSTNEHVINVYQVPLDVYKTDGSNAPLSGATFKLYKEDAVSGTTVAGLDSNHKYVEVAAATSGVDGIARLKHEGEDFGLVLGEKYYLIETQAPANYTKVSTVWEVEIQTEIGKFTDLDGKVIYSTITPDSESEPPVVVGNGVSEDMYPFNWDQGARIMLDGKDPVFVIAKGDSEDSTVQITDGSFVSHKKAISFRHTVLNLLGGKVNITVNKTWDDNDDQNRPEAIEVTLYRVSEKDHVWGEGKVVPSTCTAEGVKEYTCSVCREKDTHVISAAGHTPGTAHRENEIEATCTEAGGYDTVVRCTVCNAIISSEHTSTEALGHDWGEWQVTTPAQPGVAGVETRVCKHDASHVETREIPALPNETTITYRTYRQWYGHGWLEGTTSTTEKYQIGSSITISWSSNNQYNATAYINSSPYLSENAYIAGGYSNEYDFNGGTTQNVTPTGRRPYNYSVTVTVTDNMTIDLVSSVWDYYPNSISIAQNRSLNAAAPKSLRLSPSKSLLGADADSQSSSSTATDPVKAYLDTVPDTATCKEGENHTYKEPVGTYMITGPGWSLNIPDLPQYNEYGKPYTYYVMETPMTGYDTTYSGQDSGTTGGTVGITNTKKTVNLTVNKSWAFATPSRVASADGWPQGVTVHVVVYSSINGSTPEATSYAVDLTADRRSYTFTGLPEYSGENKIEYSVVEAGVTGVDSTSFITTITGDAASGYTITNTEKPNTKDFSFTKIWRVAVGETRTPWPSDKSITVTIKQDSDDYATYTISSDQLAEDTSIPANEDGKEPLVVTVADPATGYVFTLTGLPYGDTDAGYTYYVTEAHDQNDSEYQSPKYFNGTAQAMGASQIGDGGIIANDQVGYVLPSTGGPGTRLFTILGSILILGAGVLLWRRRRLI